ncbi:MAG: hypothetical protein AAF316_17595 [Cyanobacteria bacterium P01_A01_bin.80]
MSSPNEPRIPAPSGRGVVKRFGSILRLEKINLFDWHELRYLQVFAVKDP